MGLRSSGVGRVLLVGGGEGRSSDLHVTGSGPPLVGLLARVALIALALARLDHVVLHSNGLLHVGPLAGHMVSVDVLWLLLWLHLVGVQLVLGWTRRSLLYVLGRAGTSLRARVVGGEPGPWSLGWGAARIPARPLRGALLVGRVRS